MLDAMSDADVVAVNPDGGSSSGDWVQVIQDDEPAMFVSTTSTKDVTVLSHHFGPQGLFYELKPEVAGDKWRAPAALVHAIHGETKTFLVNALTGEAKSSEN
jgi:hypothetical protein